MIDDVIQIYIRADQKEILLKNLTKERHSGIFPSQSHKTLVKKPLEIETNVLVRCLIDSKIETVRLIRHGLKIS